MSEKTYYNESLDADFCIDIIDNFITTGDIPECNVGEVLPNEVLEEHPWRANAMVIIAKVVEMMSDPFVRLQVLTSPVGAQIFRQTTISFVRRCVEKARFTIQRTSGENKSLRQAMSWTMARRRDGWKRLASSLDQQHAKHGFEKAFAYRLMGKQGFADNDKWNKLMECWQRALEADRHEQIDRHIEMHSGNYSRSMVAAMRQAPQQIRRLKCSEQAYCRVMAFAGGQCNDADFNVLLKAAQLQEQYPTITRLARAMGRVADDDGQRMMRVSQGTVYQLDHMSGCDIHGVTVGNSLKGLMPVERTLLCDDDLQNLFFVKMVQHDLQAFRFKSELAQPARPLYSHRARAGGPMILCVDTSSSMQGLRNTIAQALLIALLQVATRQRRQLHLVTFSVNCQYADVSHDPPAAWNMLRRCHSGGTDATQMMEHVFELLGQDNEMITADVAWISDFQIPDVSQNLYDQMQHHRDCGTRFYGLMVGEATTRWDRHFDEILHIATV